MINWSLVRKISLASICVLFLVDFLPRYMGSSYGYSSIVGPREDNEKVFVPKFKRYNDNNAKKEKRRSEVNLGRMDLIRKANSDPLPPRAFPGPASKMCANNTGDDVCIPKFKQLISSIKVAPNYKLMTCIIQKSMSTVMTAIMCYLYNEKAFVKAGREFAKECIPIRFCQQKNEFGGVARLRKVHNMSTKEEIKKWQFTMITRDPLDRFLSGYVDKCIRDPRGAGYCNGCNRNMTCFILSEYDRIQTQLKMTRFVRSFEDRHFFPQNWRCNLNTEYDKYRFLRYSSDPFGTFFEDLIPILNEQHVPESSIQYIRDQLNSGRTDHSTVQTEARTFYENRLRSSPFLLEYIVRIFYYDYVLFNYPFPEGF